MYQAMPARTAAGAPILQIYHLEGRRSERLVWLCEELGLPYTLQFKRGDLAGSMQAIREISPLMPVAPTVRYGDQVVVESGAIIQMLLARHGAGRLQPAVTSPDYPYHLQWMHYAEGSFASRVIADYRVEMIRPSATPSRLVDAEDTVKFVSLMRWVRDALDATSGVLSGAFYAVIIALFWIVSPVFACIMGAVVVVVGYFGHWPKTQWVGIIIGGVLTAITGLLWLS